MAPLAALVLFFLRRISSSNLSMPPCACMYSSTNALVFLFMGMFKSMRISRMRLDESSPLDRFIYAQKKCFFFIDLVKSLLHFCFSNNTF